MLRCKHRKVSSKLNTRCGDTAVGLQDEGNEGAVRVASHDEVLLDLVPVHALRGLKGLKGSAIGMRGRRRMDDGNIKEVSFVVELGFHVGPLASLPVLVEGLDSRTATCPLDFCIL